MVNNSSEEKYVYEGVIANHDSEPFEGQVVINGDSGIIEEITSKGVYKPSKKFDDSCFIFPGMGDVHIHAREDETGDHSHKETYSTAASAAKNGGTVHISAMPNTPSPVTDEERFKWHRDRVKSVSDDISILNYVGIGNGTRPIGKLKEHFYKAYFGKSVGDLTFYDENELENTIKHYFGQKVSFHVEYQPFIDASINGKNHSERRPEGAVNFGLKLLLPLIEKYKLDSKLCHWSTGGMSFEMIEEHRERSKREGFPYTTIEVSPLHLLFDNSMTERDPSLWMKIQMNPAIQGPDHRKALIKGLKDGFIDYLATDHAPHKEEEKYKAFNSLRCDYPNLSNVEIANEVKKHRPDLFQQKCCEDGTPGAPWLDVYAPVTVKLMNDYGFKPQDVARFSSFNPGKFVNEYLSRQYEEFDFGKGFGKVEEGYVGSLSVINTNSPFKMTRDRVKSKAGWSPLEGMNFEGGLETLILRGKEL